MGSVLCPERSSSSGGGGGGTGRHRRTGNSSPGIERGMCLQALFMSISVSHHLERSESVTALSLISSSV